LPNKIDFIRPNINIGLGIFKYYYKYKNTMGTIYMTFIVESKVKGLGQKFNLTPREVLNHLFEFTDLAKFEEYLTEKMANGPD